MEKKKKEKVANKKTAQPFLYPSVYTEDKPKLVLQATFYYF
jgi:hypothetical protein